MQPVIGKSPIYAVKANQEPSVRLARIGKSPRHGADFGREALRDTKMLVGAVTNRHEGDLILGEITLKCIGFHSQ